MAPRCGRSLEKERLTIRATWATLRHEKIQKFADPVEVVGDFVRDCNLFPCTGYRGAGVGGAMNWERTRKHWADYRNSMNNTYFETFGAALDGALRAADLNRALLHHPEDVRALANEPLNYGETRRGSFSIELLRDRRTRKYFHVVLYRPESGRYELTAYVS
jgi:hypothetical protein